MSLPPWRTLQALLSLWSTSGMSRPASAAPRLLRSISEGQGTAAAAAATAVPMTRASSVQPAKVTRGFDISPEAASPVSGLVLRPSFAGSDDQVPATLFSAAGSSGFVTPVGSSGNASLLSSSLEMDKPMLLGTTAIAFKQLW